MSVSVNKKCPSRLIKSINRGGWKFCPPLRSFSKRLTKDIFSSDFSCFWMDGACCGCLDASPQWSLGSCIGAHESAAHRPTTRGGVLVSIQSIPSSSDRSSHATCSSDHQLCRYIQILPQAACLLSHGEDLLSKTWNARGSMYYIPI
jgi:hypothetical protein